MPTLDVLYPWTSPPSTLAPWPDAPECAVGKYDTIIIFGCPTNEDGTPSDCQKRRVDLAMQFSRSGYGDRFITSGSAVYTDGIEARSLQQLLVEAGVEEGHIWMDQKAEHTDENLYFASEIMVDRGWESALVVSDSAHLLYAAVCDANCCVKRGRLATLSFPTDDGDAKAAHYVLTPPADPVTEDECLHLTNPTRLQCTNIDARRACEDNFQL